MNYFAENTETLDTTTKIAEIKANDESLTEMFSNVKDAQEILDHALKADARRIEALKALNGVNIYHIIGLTDSHYIFTKEGQICERIDGETYVIGSGLIDFKIYVDANGYYETVVPYFKGQAIHQYSANSDEVIRKNDIDLLKMILEDPSQYKFEVVKA